MKKLEPAPMGQLLLMAFRWFDESLLALLKEQGWPELTHSQSMVMAFLGAGGIRISALAKRLGISRQAAQKTVSELEKAELLETEIDQTNSSAKIIVLTTKGKANVVAALNLFSEIELELADRIGTTNLVNMRKALEKDWGAAVTEIDYSRKTLPKSRRPKTL